MSAPNHYGAPAWIRAITPSVTCRVVAVTGSMADISPAAAVGSPKGSSIRQAVQKVPIGLAMNNAGLGLGDQNQQLAGPGWGQLAGEAQDRGEAGPGEDGHLAARPGGPGTGTSLCRKMRKEWIRPRCGTRVWRQIPPPLPGYCRRRS